MVSEWVETAASWCPAEETHRSLIGHYQRYRNNDSIPTISRVNSGFQSVKRPQRPRGRRQRPFRSSAPPRHDDDDDDGRFAPSGERPDFAECVCVWVSPPTADATTQAPTNRDRNTFSSTLRHIFSTLSVPCWCFAVFFLYFCSPRSSLHIFV
jgi:hypothetical protein